MPTLKSYDGTGDPANRIRTFSNAILLQPISDAVKFQAFLQTMWGMAQRWYSRLPPNSIGSFKQLSREFIGQFTGGKTHEKSSTSLMNLLQGKNESMRDYINCFTKKVLKVLDYYSLTTRNNRYVFQKVAYQASTWRYERSSGKTRKNGWGFNFHTFRSRGSNKGNLHQCLLARSLEGKINTKIFMGACIISIVPAAATRAPVYIVGDNCVVGQIGW